MLYADDSVLRGESMKVLSLETGCHVEVCEGRVQEEVRKGSNNCSIGKQWVQILRIYIR